MFRQMQDQQQKQQPQQLLLPQVVPQYQLLLGGLVWQQYYTPNVIQQLTQQYEIPVINTSVPLNTVTVMGHEAPEQPKQEFINVAPVTKTTIEIADDETNGIPVTKPVTCGGRSRAKTSTANKAAKPPRPRKPPVANEGVSKTAAFDAISEEPSVIEEVSVSSSPIHQEIQEVVEYADQAPSTPCVTLPGEEPVTAPVTKKRCRRKSDDTVEKKKRTDDNGNNDNNSSNHGNSNNDELLKKRKAKKTKKRDHEKTNENPQTQPSLLQMQPEQPNNLQPNNLQNDLQNDLQNGTFAQQYQQPPPQRPYGNQMPTFVEAPYASHMSLFDFNSTANVQNGNGQQMLPKNNGTYFSHDIIQ